MTDPQLTCYRTMPRERYAHAADLIDLQMRIGSRPCAGGWCDGDSGACPRHERSERVAERYLRMKARGR